MVTGDPPPRDKFGNIMRGVDELCLGALGPGEPLYTAAQLHQSRIDALEEAAKVAADFFEPRLSDPLWTVRNLAQMDIAAAIRKLKETDNG